MMRTSILASLLLGMAVCLAAPRAQADDSSATVAVLTIKGSLPESAGQLGLFGELGANLGDILKRLDQAANDDDISAVVLEIRNPSIGRGKLNELREAVGRVRSEGKRVVAQLEAATMQDYLLASACDEIVMPESGTLIIPGVRVEVMFYKGLFEKLGVEADMMRMGDYKGAAEPYTRESMSPELRSQYELLVDDIYDQLISMIAEDRDLEADKVRELIDVGLFTPAQAQEAGLIDSVAYDDQLSSGLQESLAVEEVELERDYAKKKVDSDFSGMLGMMKLFEMMMGVESSKRASSNKKIAIIYATGMIMPGKSTSSILGDQIMGSDTIVKALRDAENDKTVAAIVLRIDSPGGSALASDLIWRATRQCEKPLIASMGDVAGSGGYYISMGCDTIYAEPGTLTGSIGVLGGKIAVGGLVDKGGLTTDVISRGQNSGIYSMDRPFSDSERAATRRMIEEVYRQFVTKAAEGRGMSVEEIEPLAGGRVWTGRQARAKGLIDELGTLRDAVAAAKQEAGLGEEEKVELLILPRPTSVLDQLLGIDAEVQSPLSIGLSEVAPEAAQILRDASQIKRLFSEPALFLMPHAIRVR